jgi:hypothetical protein
MIERKRYLVLMSLCLVAFLQDIRAVQAAPVAAPGGAPAVVAMPAPPPAGVKTCTPGTDTKCAPVQASEPPEGQDPFRGLKWGLGVAFSSSLGGVGTVAIDPTSKVVHVTKLNNSAARGAFELHYFFKFCNQFAVGGPFMFLPNVPVSATNTFECPAPSSEFGMGPFVSLNTSPFDTSSNFTSKLFDSIGAGWMVGLNAYDAQPAAPTVVHSINLGVGLILDTGVRQLALGVQDGQVTAVTNADLLTTQSTKIGWMAILSYRLFEVNLK